MTREGAIGNLIHAIRWNDMPKKEALKMAIQALEQEPTNEQVEEYCRKHCLTLVSNEFMAHIIADSDESIRTILSTVLRIGHWIDYDCDEDKYDKIKCSECGRSYIVDSYHWCDIGFTKDDLKYCPDCGARMSENPTGSKDVQKQDAEIKVGDEVITKIGNKGVVIMDVPCEDGSICVWFPTCNRVQMYPVKDLSKTGRHFDQITEVLAEMRGEE